MLQMNMLSGEIFFFAACHSLGTPFTDLTPPYIQPLFFFSSESLTCWILTPTQGACWALVKALLSWARQNISLDMLLLGQLLHNCILTIYSKFMIKDSVSIPLWDMGKMLITKLNTHPEITSAIFNFLRNPSRSLNALLLFPLKTSRENDVEVFYPFPLRLTIFPLLSSTII